MDGQIVFEGPAGAGGECGRAGGDVAAWGGGSLWGRDQDGDRLGSPVPFQVHGVDETGQPALRRKLRRAEVLRLFCHLEPALVGIEACHTAHHWAREIAALGHEVRLMPPQFVRPYVKSQKNDAADAEAICEAVQRPTMRFVPVKGADQQAVLLLHRTRDLLIRQRSSLISVILS